MNNAPGYNGSSPSSDETKRCPRCGKELPSGASFCGECGFNLSANGAGQPYTIPPQPVQPPADTAPLKTSDYLVLLILAAVPLVGLILMLVWAFGSNGNLNRRNFCRAQLIFTVISTVLSVLLLIFYASLFSSVLASGELDSIFGMIFH